MARSLEQGRYVETGSKVGLTQQIYPITIDYDQPAHSHQLGTSLLR
jgi:hypothetical protein